MATTTLERPSFVMGKRGHCNFKVDAIGTIAAGNTITVTHPTNGKAIVGTVEKLLPFGSFTMLVTQSPVPSGALFFPKGSSVA